MLFWEEGQLTYLTTKFKDKFLEDSLPCHLSLFSPSNWTEDFHVGFLSLRSMAGSSLSSLKWRIAQNPKKSSPP